LPLAALAIGALTLGLWGLRVLRAEVTGQANREMVRQITVFAIVATPGSKEVDAKLAEIQPQLSQLLPKHGFKLLDVQSERLVAGESVGSNLDHGYTAETTMVQPIDENGKVQLRCEIFIKDELQFSATVKAPLNQLFFCERPFLSDGSKLLIGLGAR
jgi:hypothetical protein